jgi:lipopolysaccharide export system protein LptC
MTEPTAPATQAHDAERVHAAVEQWRRRSRLIRFFRKALPIGIGSVFVLILGWVLLRSLLVNLPNLSPNGAVLRMTNPHFYGQDAKGRSFVLGAREAERDTRGVDVVRLHDPELRLSTGPERKMEIMAKSGVYNLANRQARLTGGVTVRDTPQGYLLQTGEAQIDTKSGYVAGNSTVNGRGPLGQISASSYAIYDQGARVTFTGNVHSRIEQPRRR